MTQLTRGPAPTSATPSDSQLGLPQSTALVMGSIIGVGIFSLPYAIASYGPISLVAMALATVGAVALAFMFAVLSRRIPAEGGPYGYGYRYGRSNQMSLSVEYSVNKRRNARNASALRIVSRNSTRIKAPSRKD